MPCDACVGAGRWACGVTPGIAAAIALGPGRTSPDDIQHVVREHGRFVARVDLWYDGVVAEADGFAHHSNRRDYRADRRKGQAFARLGLLLLRFSWEDIQLAPDAVIATVRDVLRHEAA